MGGERPFTWSCPNGEVAPKAASPRLGFQQAMDRLRLDPGALGEALGGTAGGGAERDCGGLREKDLEDGVDQSRLTDARTTGDHQHLGNESNANSLSLAIGERQLRPLLDPRDGLVGIDRRPRRSSDSECLELFSDLPLSSVKPARKTHRRPSRSSAITAPASSSWPSAVSTSSAGTSSSV